jgi:hypothetical protein
LLVKDKCKISTDHLQQNCMRSRNQVVSFVLLSLTSSQVVTLEFDEFNTASGDTVYIHDGSTSAATTIATLAGNYATPPSAYTTTQPYMLVRFVSNAATNSRGFSATYRTTTSGW